MDQYKQLSRLIHFIATGQTILAIVAGLASSHTVFVDIVNVDDLAYFPDSLTFN